MPSAAGLGALFLAFVINITAAAQNGMSVSDTETKTAVEILSELNEYSGKEITMRLRLKYIDRVFEKIVFYDKKNYDVEFDINRKVLHVPAEKIRGLHEGLEYIVNFRVKGVGGNRTLAGELLKLEPAFLVKVPENERGPENGKAE